MARAYGFDNPSHAEPIAVPLASGLKAEVSPVVAYLLVADEAYDTGFDTLPTSLASLSRPAPVSTGSLAAAVTPVRRVNAPPAMPVPTCPVWSASQALAWSSGPNTGESE